MPSDKVIRWANGVPTLVSPTEKANKKIIESIKCNEKAKDLLIKVAEKCCLNEDYAYPQSWDSDKIVAPSTNDKAVDMMLQDFFNVAFRETIKMIKKSKEK